MTEPARAIEFGDCGFAHLLYDMGVTLLMLCPFDRDGSQQAAFLEGYRRLRAFSSEHEQLPDLFIAPRSVALARLFMGNARFRSDSATRWVARTVKRLKVCLDH